jgi:hypothetical protein
MTGSRSRGKEDEKLHNLVAESKPSAVNENKK